MNVVADSLLKWKWKAAQPGKKGAYVSWVPKKKMGYLLAGGLTAPSGSSSIWSTGKERLLMTIYYKHSDADNCFYIASRVFKSIIGYYLKACLSYHRDTVNPVKLN